MLWCITEKLPQNKRRTNMNISQEGISLIKKFEGCEFKAYKCAAGKWTIGFGRIKNVKEGDTCTQEQAEEWLKEELLVYGSYVNSAVTVPLEQNEFDALVAWTYNLGPTNLNSSTMLRVLNENKKDEVPHQMRKWNKARVNGEKVVLPGLERRRLAESLLFEGKEWHEV